MCMSCATSADALLGGGIVSAAGLRVALRSWRPSVRARFGRTKGGDGIGSTSGGPVTRSSDPGGDAGLMTTLRSAELDGQLPATSSAHAGREALVSGGAASAAGDDAIAVPADGRSGAATRVPAGAR